MHTASDDTDSLRAALITLTPAQAIAAEALATGSTHAEAAEVSGVSRETVTRWAGHHPEFCAALSRYRCALADEQVAVVRRLHKKALLAVERALDDGDVSAALSVLRYVPVPESGGAPLDADAVVDSAINRARFDLRPLPPPRDQHGNIDTLAELLDTRGPTDYERAERVAIDRLASASGLCDDA